MNRKVTLAAFVSEQDLLVALRAVHEHGWAVSDIYTPHTSHEMDEALNWPRSRLPLACFLGGAAGAGLALWFQYWASASDWPINVGGRPWNSLPAFVPVTFECMVLLAGFTLLFAWLIRSRLYPGKTAILPLAGVTDDRFVMALAEDGASGSADAQRQLLHDCHATLVEQRVPEELR
jgi:Protein of unknown function (DUF3341)